MDSQRVLAVWVTVLVSPANAQFVLHFFIEFFCNRIIEEGGHTGGKQNGRYYARHETDALYGHVRLYNRRAGHISESRKQQACESSAEAQPGFQGIYDTGKAETGGPAFVDILYMVGYVANHGLQQGHGGSVGQTFEDSEQEDGLDVADAWQVEQSREESRQ